MESSLLANICCSFEQEPQTLSEGQLTQAREVAQNQEPTEASATVFHQQGVGGDGRKRGMMEMKQNAEQVKKMELHERRNTQHKDHKTRHCFCCTA